MGGAHRISQSFVFLSYRREDTEISSELLYELLCSRLGRAKVLKDVHSAPLGEDFRSWISENVRGSSVMLVVIGPKWLTSLQDRRQSGRVDYVLVELEEAFEQGIPTIAVLVDGATMPISEDLPSRLKGFTFLNASTIPAPPHLSDAVLALASRLTEQFPELLLRPVNESAQYFRRGRIAQLMALATVVAIIAGHYFLPPSEVNKVHLAALLHDNLWIEYSPPMEEAFHSLPPSEREFLATSLRTELGALKQAGFTGILANGDAGATVMIPHVAKELGLKVIVICGFLGNSQDREVALAKCFLLRDTVDGYCIGYDQLGRDYQASNLRAAIDRLKKRTGLPTATTQPATLYTNNERLVSIGDWLFPEVHLDLLADHNADQRVPEDLDAVTFAGITQAFSVDINRDIERFRSSAIQLAEVAKSIDKPIMFNGVSYPHKDVEGSSPEMQAAFFGRLIDSLTNPRTGLGIHVSMVVHSAFDREWRIYLRDPDSDWSERLRPGYEAWMSYTGLFSDDGFPRPAALEILKRHPNWQPPATLKKGDL